MERVSPNSDPPDVVDHDSAIGFIRWCVATIGRGYHPDTPFSEYVTPEGNRFFTASEAARLDELQNASFKWCDPYELGIAEFEAVGRMKRPLQFHSPSFQEWLIREGTREQIIVWLCWNDPNGVYTDDDSQAEGYHPLTRERAAEIMSRQVSQ